MDTAGRGRRLYFHGMLLVVVGLLIGLVVQAFANPRMGLSAHTGTLMNGILVIAMGAFWSRLGLTARSETVAWWLVVAGSWMNCAGLVGAAAFATKLTTPLHGAERPGSAVAEAIVGAFLVVGGVAFLVGCVVAAWGLRGSDRT